MLRKSLTENSEGSMGCDSVRILDQQLVAPVAQPGAD